MKVINVLADGTEVDDISQYEVPITNTVYDVCQNIEKGKGCKELLVSSSANKRVRVTDL